MAKTLKKLAAIVLALSLTLCVLAGCSKTEDDPKNPNNPGNQDNPGNQNNPGDQDNPGNQDNPGEQITLRYAAWDLATEEEYNIFRRMVDKYMELHKNIKIEIAEDITTAPDWNAAMTTAAASSNLPDVFFSSELPTTVANEWALDVTPYITGDADWAKIPTSLTESVKYGSGSYALPYAMHIQGAYINVDMFESKNKDPLEYGYTMDEFKDAVEYMSDPSNGETALMTSEVMDWYPGVAKEGLGFFTYSNGELHLNDPAYIEGLKFANEIYSNGYAFNGLTPISVKIGVTNKR